MLDNYPTLSFLRSIARKTEAGSKLAFFFGSKILFFQIKSYKEFQYIQHI